MNNLASKLSAVLEGSKEMTCHNENYDMRLNPWLHLNLRCTVIVKKLIVLGLNIQ